MSTLALQDGIDNHLYSKDDLSTFSNASQAVSTHIKLDWDIDFDNQKISGSAEHVIKVLISGTTHVTFDSSNINLVDDVMVDGTPVECIVSDRHPVLGTMLSVSIPIEYQAAESTFSVLFNYFINDASAMQWLPATATKGGKHPFLFTQSQAIHARSLMPCMDSPGIKTPYTARVTAPNWCTVLMSALADTPNTSVVTTEEDKNVFYWTQPVPTPAYLVALAAGRMESREISDRVRVWAEPEVVEDALFEFSETEQFVKAAEELTGCSYQWTRYDVLCLPPSFPYGGMENPCLTFATPTLLAGDRSLADVIAHEIAHSWTGNLVTNHTWDHFWLNEGWTVWLERKITSKVKGNVEIGKLSAQIGWKHLQDDVELLGAENPNTRLLWSIAEGEDPDDAYSSVPYEKGCNLLGYLEELVGADKFGLFVKAYIEKFKYHTITTGDFRDFFVSFYEAAAAAPVIVKEQKKSKKRGVKQARQAAAAAAPDPAAVAIFEKVKLLDWDAIFLSTGMPNYGPSFCNSLSSAAEALAEKWIAQATLAQVPSAVSGFSANDIKSWSTQQINVFLETLANHAKGHELSPEEVFSVPFLECLDNTYGFSKSKNAEIMLRWQSLCLMSEAKWIVPQVVAFITSQGRMKFARPLYRALRGSTVGKQDAIDTFEKFQNMYHPIARKMVAADLKRAADVENALAVEDAGVSTEADVTIGNASECAVEAEVEANAEPDIEDSINVAVDSTDEDLFPSPGSTNEVVNALPTQLPIVENTLPANTGATVEPSLTSTSVKVDKAEIVIVPSPSSLQDQCEKPTPVQNETLPSTVEEPTNSLSPPELVNDEQNELVTAATKLLTATNQNEPPAAVADVVNSQVESTPVRYAMASPATTTQAEDTGNSIEKVNESDDLNHSLPLSQSTVTSTARKESTTVAQNILAKNSLPEAPVSHFSNVGDSAVSHDYKNSSDALVDPNTIGGGSIVMQLFVWLGISAAAVGTFYFWRFRGWK